MSFEFTRIGTVPHESGARYLVTRAGREVGMVEYRDPLGGWTAYGPERKPPHGVRGCPRVPGVFASRRQAALAALATYA